VVNNAGKGDKMGFWESRAKGNGDIDDLLGSACGIHDDRPAPGDDAVRWLDSILCTTARPGSANSYACPAAAGYARVPDHHFHSAMLYYAGESSYVRLLRLPLLESAIKLRKRSRWNRLFKGRPWTPDLVSLALREYENPAIKRLRGWWRIETECGPEFVAWNAPGAEFVHGWWSCCFGADQQQWSRTFSPRYESIRAILDGWRDSATRRIGEQLVGLMPEDDYISKTYKTTTKFHDEGLRIPGKGEGY